MIGRISMNIKKIYTLQTDCASYRYPLTKIAISVLVVLFGMFRNRLFVIPYELLSFALALICFAAGLAAILCVYISVGELFYVRRNKRKRNASPKPSSDGEGGTAQP